MIKIINTKKINEGDVIKNYKEMCYLLDENILDGCTKKTQLKEWERYFDFGRKGQKFIIEKIYDIPKPKTLRENTVYVKNIESLLMYKLSKKAGYRCSYTKTNLFKLLGMINNNYFENRKRVVSEKLKELNKWEVKHFYERTSQKLSEILFSALNSMKRRCLIDYTEQNIIVENTGEKRVTHRAASISETEDILRVKKKTLSEMGYTKIPFLKFNEFYDKVNERLYELYNWSYIYKEYQIIYNKDFMKNAIDIVKKEIKDELYKKQIKLNCDIISAVNKQAYKLFEKNKNKTPAGWVDDSDLGEKLINSKKSKFYYTYDYVEIQNDLAEFLLRI